VPPTIERIDSGCASNLMRVLIFLAAPSIVFKYVSKHIKICIMSFKKARKCEA